MRKIRQDIVLPERKTYENIDTIEFVVHRVYFCIMEERETGKEVINMVAKIGSE